MGFHPDHPPILFFCQTGVDEGRSSFAEYWPEARAVADPKSFYHLLPPPEPGSMTTMKGDHKGGGDRER
ncbi:MAG TPA: hypothetical protein VH475_02615 [Tepidisphaeraceae bacterium]|jgi:hypothetical protein